MQVSEPSANVTELLGAVRAGEPGALDGLLAAVYDDLRAMAQRFMAREARSHTLQPTALVHEAYVKLVDQRSAQFHDRAHFLGAAATLIRRILVDHARAKKAAKRGGDWRQVALDVASLSDDQNLGRILALDEAILRLEEDDPRAGAVVRLRFYAGLTIDQTAHSLGISPRTVKREWNFARTCLLHELERRVLGEGNDRVHHLEGGQDRHTIFE